MAVKEDMRRADVERGGGDYADDSWWNCNLADDGSTDTSRWWNRLYFWRTVSICFFCINGYFLLTHHAASKRPIDGALCPQPAPLQPHASQRLVDAYAGYDSESYRNRSAELLGGAVRVPSMSFDDLGPVGEDPRWDVFGDLAAYLSHSFPRVHKTLGLEMVDTHGLLYTWAGSDASLKPLILMAHQDVVPVEDPSTWERPPFSGAFDGSFVYGRGASDCKNILVAILESIESLIDAGHSPRRTVVLSFGFDEESQGQTALQLAQRLESIYGAGGVALIVDEGVGFSEMYGEVFAVPGVAEKGYLDAIVEVRMAGGHSSIPPPHTSIGVLSELVRAIEAAPYSPVLSESNPLWGALQCAAAYAELPKDVEKLVRKGDRSRLAKKLAEQDAEQRYLMSTSLAATVVRGGVKVNALPEQAQVTINHRIAIDSSVEFVQRKLKSVVAPVAKKFGLDLIAWPEHEHETGSDTIAEFDRESDVQAAGALAGRSIPPPRSGGTVILRATENTLRPAPITPLGTPQWNLLAGTIRHVFRGLRPGSINARSQSQSQSRSHQSDGDKRVQSDGNKRGGSEGEGVKVAPGMSTGNTDTKNYWNLSKHIYRFEPSFTLVEGNNIHTVNEKCHIEAHLEAVRFYHTFLLNVDQATGF